MSLTLFLIRKMDEKLKPVLHKVILLTRQNPEFSTELRKALEITPSAMSVSNINNSVTRDIASIREALEIRANASITYAFVGEQRLRDQLLIDNLRMENAALKLKEPEAERFYSFCVNAFYQLENIVNYYFYVTFPDIDGLLAIIEKYTEEEKNNDFKFKRNGREKNVSDIPIAHKINAICNILFPGDRFKMTLGQLRQVRNEGEHRCMIIQQEKNDKNSLYNFFKYNTFNTIRIYLIKMVNSIKNNIGKPIVENKTNVEVVISSLLPSACFVKLDDRTEPLPLPERLLSKVKDKKNGDKMTLIIVRGRIVDIELKD